MYASTKDKTRYESARSWAERKLSFRFAGRYRELYLAEKAGGKPSHNGGTRVRALRQLVREHPAEYRRLLDARLVELRQHDEED